MGTPAGNDFTTMLQRAREMQGDLLSAKMELQSLEAVGHSMNGAVTATVGGEGLLTALTIDSSVIDPGNPQHLADLVLTAVNAAGAALGEQRIQRFGSFQRSMQELMSGLRHNNT